MSTIDKIDKFHKTRKGLLIFGFVELFVAYLFVSLAIDQGNFLYYIIFALLTIGSFNNLIRGFINKPKVYGKKSRNK